MQQYQNPPPPAGYPQPAAPPPPNTVPQAAPAQQYAPAPGYPQQAPGYLPQMPALQYAPAPSYQQQAPQGFAAPAPQGFQQAPQVVSPSLNTVSVSDLNLLPAVNITAQTKFQVLSYVKSNRQSGPAYTVGLRVVSSSAQEMPAGSTFNLLCKISLDPRKQGGDKTRKKFVAGVFNVSPNAAIDWDAADAQLLARDYQAQPLFVELDQRINYGRPVLDQNTKQPVSGQWWSDSTWRLSSGG